MVLVPFWFYVVLLSLSGLFVLLYLLLPSLRWFFRRKINKLIHQLNESLDIELPPFKLTQRQSLIDNLICDHHVLDAAKEWAHEEEETLDEAQRMVHLYAREIVPSFNAYFYFKVAHWLARAISTMLFRVRMGQESEQINQIDHDAAVIFVINHRSNLDYVLVSTFVAQRTAVSYAVGEWARVWPLHSLIRSLGAYFVRRKSSNQLYRKVLERYVQMATQAGVTQAIFLEGKLTTSGLLNPPRLGLLDYMLRDYNPEKDKDLVFVPVAINYDRTLEDRSLLRSNQKGVEKQPMTRVVKKTVGYVGKVLFMRMIGRWHRFGYACVNFGEPLSIQEYLKREQIELEHLSRDERFNRVEGMAQELMKRIGGIVPVLPVSLVSKVFLEQEEGSLSLLELKARVFQMMTDFQSRGVQLYVPRHDMDYAIQVGLRMLTLRRLVVEEEGYYSLNPDETEILNYYANALAHY